MLSCPCLPSAGLQMCASIPFPTRDASNSWVGSLTGLQHSSYPLLMSLLYSWSVSANESIFLLLPAFLPDDWPPWGCCSWPCLHQVRCTSFYFVFHQLELHKTALVSGDCCQKLQSPSLLRSVALFMHLSTGRYLM